MAKKISELTAASGASSTSPVPMVQGGATMGVEAGLLVRSSTALGNMQSLVQTLIDTASVADRNRGNHTGQMAAANVDVAYNGKTVEACITEIYAALAGGGPSAPTIASVPTIAGTPAVGQTLTATANSEPANTTTTWQWNEDGAQISGATASTLNLQSAQLGKYITVTQRSTNTTGGLYSESTSAATAVVTGTVPSNTLAPSISPSGSQTVGQTHTVSTGVWDDASTYGIQFYYASVPEGVRSSTTTITPDATKAGLTLTFDVIGYSSIGVASAAVAGSNSVTLTGTAAVVNTVAPAWDTNLYFGVTNDFTEGTWTGTIDATRQWEFFRNSETVAYVSPPNTLSLHTPRSPAVVGDTLYIEETVTETATGNTFKARSTGKVITAAPATLAVALTAAGSAGYTWTTGSSITQANPATITGGTAPYTATIANLTWATVTVSGGNVYINGTPPSVVSSTTRTITVRDSAASPATVTVDFTMQINSSSVTPLSEIGTLYLEAGGYDWGSVGAYANDTKYGVVPSDSTVRCQYFAGVDGKSAPGYLLRTKKGDGAIYSGHRAELGRYSEEYLTTGVDYWWAWAMKPISAEWPEAYVSDSSDIHAYFQIHQYVGPDVGPIFSLGRAANHWDEVASATRTNTIAIKRVWSVSNEIDTSLGNNANTTILKPGTWTGHILHLRFGDTLAEAPRVEYWVDGVKRIDWSGTDAYMGNLASDNGEYTKFGIYFWYGDDSGGSAYGAITTRAMYMSKMFFGQGASLYDRALASITPYI